MTTSFFSKKGYLNFIKSFCRERKEGKKRKKKKKQFLFNGYNPI